MFSSDFRISRIISWALHTHLMPDLSLVTESRAMGKEPAGTWSTQQSSEYCSPECLWASHSGTPTTTRQCQAQPVAWPPCLISSSHYLVELMTSHFSDKENEVRWEPVTGSGFCNLRQDGNGGSRHPVLEAERPDKPLLGFSHRVPGVPQRSC